MDEEINVRETLSEVLTFVSKRRIGMMTNKTIKGYLVARPVTVVEIVDGITLYFIQTPRLARRKIWTKIRT